MKQSLALHPGSLARIPLARHLLSDPSVRLSERAIDNNWVYSRFFRAKMTGFNPYLGRIFYGSKSCLADWLADPYASARKHNDGDFLVVELLFALHDYLHCWSVQAIQELAPQLGFGTGAITRRSSEDFVFCHLLTEAVATAGVDYWYLATVDLNRVCDIGTRVTDLTTRYHERHRAEYRRYNPAFEAQRPDFLVWLTDFYCSGTFRGFGIESLRESPIVRGWIEHEVSYGQLQRKYIREWLGYMSEEDLGYEPAKLARTVRTDARWKRRLAADVAELLWEKVKQDKLHRFLRASDPRDGWQASPRKELDFRFVNLPRSGASARQALREAARTPTNLEFFIWQHASRFDLSLQEPDRRQRFRKLLSEKDAKGVQGLFDERTRLEAAETEPRILFFPN